MAAIAATAPGAITLRAPAGRVLFRPDDPCGGFIALRRGSIRVGLSSISGRELVLYRVRPGQICLQTFACLIEGLHYGAEGVAELDIDAVLLPPPVFDDLMAGNALFRGAVLGSVASRFGDLESVVQALAFTGLPARVASALMSGAIDNRLTVTHEAIAAEIGSAREAVSRQLAQMARDGLISQSRGRIQILDPAALARLAKSGT